MNVFISWSGLRSQSVAKVVKKWIPSVIQTIEPWMSVDGIDRGQQWFSVIGSKLNESTIGIFCLTQSNKNKPWILFEAGAVAKGSRDNAVCTLLIDLKHSDIIDSPLSHYNHTVLNKEQMLALAQSINRKLERPVPGELLQDAFSRSWPEFEEQFKQAVIDNPADDDGVSKPTDNDLLQELLSGMRSLAAQIALTQGIPSHEQLLENPYIRPNMSSLAVWLLDNLGEEERELMARLTLEQLEMTARWTQQLVGDKYLHDGGWKRYELIRETARKVQGQVLNGERFAGSPIA